MPKLKTRIIGKAKDKASTGKVRLVYCFGSRSIKCIHLALLKSTDHTSHKPPNSNYVSAVLSYSNSRYSPAVFAAVRWRLRVTKNALVATKSLIVFHKLMISSKDKFEGFHLGHQNILKLNDFSDKSSNLTLELSQWTRWYAMYLDHFSWVSKLLGSYPRFRESTEEKAKEQECVWSYQTGNVMRQTDSLVTFFEHICTRPETPPLYQNKIVDEIRELVMEDYLTGMRLLIVRLQVLSERLIKPGLESDGDFSWNDLSSVLVRLEECKNSLSGFFWRGKRLAEDFWCLVKKLKAETVKANTEFVELAGLPHSERVTFEDSKMTMEEVANWNSEWETFDGFEMATNEVLKWNSDWDTFDEPVWFSLHT